jgi:Flp pilus assembly protein TadG
MKQALRNRKREKGVAAVELALMLPFLVVFFLIIIDLGMILREHQVLSNAAREGARFSSLPKNWISTNNPTATVAAIQNRVIEYCAQENLAVNSGQITITQTEQIPVGSQFLEGSRVTVTADRPLMFLGGLIGGSTVQLTGTSVFANLY